MATFHDTAGRPWTIRVDVAVIEAVRGAGLGVDLLRVLDDGDDTLVRLQTDPVLLCNVLYVVCAAQHGSISPDEFKRAMAGDSIGDATAALLEELVNFSPNPRLRAARKQILDLARETEDRTLSAVEARLGSSEFRQKLDAKVRSQIGSFGGAPESSASSPGG